MNKTFLHISDIHFRRQYPQADSGYGALFHRLEPPFSLIDRVFTLVEPERLDFVLLTGDLTEDGDAEDYRALRDYLGGKLGGVPVFPTLGNHDNRAAFYSGWLDEPPSAQPCHRLWELGDLAVISLDNSKPGQPDGGLDSGDVDWLARTLDRLGDRPSLLITHHHLLPGQYPIPAAPYPPELERVIRASGVLGIFNGHTHHLYCGHFGGKPYFTGDSLSFAADKDGDGLHFEARAGVSLFSLTDEGFALQPIRIHPRGERLVSIQGSPLH